MATSPNSSLVRDLDKYVVPPGELTYGEYVYRIPLRLKESGSKKSKHVKFKYELDPNLLRIISALLNTSGGVIHVIPCIPEKLLGGKDFDEWCNNLTDQLSFLPEVVCQQCVSMHSEVDNFYVLVHKSKQFITTESHVYTRGICENRQTRHFDGLSHLVSRTMQFGNSRSISLPLEDSVEFNTVCPKTESKSVEYKCYQCTTVADLITRIKKHRALEAVFAMANIEEGGYVIFGVKEDDCTKHLIYLGQELDESDEGRFKQEFSNLMVYDEFGHRRIWGKPDAKPQEGKDWTCTFKLVHNFPSHSKRRVLIVIHINHCTGGMFERKPEAFTITDDGYIAELSFEEWQAIHVKVSCIEGTHTTSTPPKKIRRTKEPQEKLPSTCTSAASISPQTTFKDNCTISYKDHSSGWRIFDATPKNAAEAKHQTLNKLFQMEFPVKYTPSRRTIQEKVQHTSTLSHIDQTVGKPAFGIATNSILECIEHTCSLACVTQLPPHHTMDLCVVTETGSIFLFVSCSGYETTCEKQAQSSYGMISTRLLKRRILEAMPDLNINGSVFIQCEVIYTNESHSPTPPSYQRWFKSTQNDQLHALRVSLKKVLSTKDTIFRDIIIKDNELQLSQHQIAVLMEARNSRFNIVEAPPGCGKTIMAKHICEKFGKENSAYISASIPLNNRVGADAKVSTYHVTHSALIVQLLSDALGGKQHIVIDDNQNITYSEEDLHTICANIASAADRHLYFFQDSFYQNYHVGQGASTFELFCMKNKRTYGSVSMHSMNEIQRNTRVVGSFLMGQVSTLNPGSHAEEFKCMSRVKGDDINVKHIHNLRLQGKDNGLLAHVRKLLSTPIDSKNNMYAINEVAIICDHRHVKSAKVEVEMFQELFKEFWPESNVQAAETYPVRGVIVDLLQHFWGLESKLILYILPKYDIFGTGEEERHRATRHRIAIASRGVDRVDFLQDDNINGKTAALMKLDQCPDNLIQSVPTSMKVTTERDPAKSTNKQYSSEGATPQTDEDRGYVMPSTTSSNQHAITIPVKGLTMKCFHPALHELQAVIHEPGTVDCRLTPEPDNPLDKNALMIDAFVRGEWRPIGYVGVTHNPRVHAAIEEGSTLYISLVKDDFKIIPMFNEFYFAAAIVIRKRTPWLDERPEQRYNDALNY